MVYWATLPLPETRHFFPSSVCPFVDNISAAKYTAPYPVASGRMSEPPQFKPFPVSTPVNSLRNFLYWPNKKPISRPPTPMSPAGTSVSGPMWRNRSLMNGWQNRMTSLSLLPLGSKSEPPLAPPSADGAQPVLEGLPEGRNFSSPRVTVGWNRRPPLYGPIALL